jgi:TolA-binding protein
MSLRLLQRGDLMRTALCLLLSLTFASNATAQASKGATRVADTARLRMLEARVTSLPDTAQIRQLQARVDSLTRILDSVSGQLGQITVSLGALSEKLSSPLGKADAGADDLWALLRKLVDRVCGNQSRDKCP